MSNEVDLGKEPIGRLLFTLAVPAIASQIVNALYNMVDRMYIGHIADVGANALTGVGVCFPIIMIISAFAALVSMGGAPRASILLGQNNHKGAEKILGNCFSALVLTAIILTVGALLFQKPLLLLFGASENTLFYAKEYIGIILLGCTFNILSFALNSTVRADGNPKMSSITMVIGCGANIILDYLFIFVLNLGVKGAALATIISQAITFFIILYYYTAGNSNLKLKIENFKLKKHLVTMTFAIGIAPFATQIANSLVQVIANNALKTYGNDLAIGAMTVISSLNIIFMMPIFGINQGCQPIIGFNYGAKKYERAKEAFKYATIAACVICIIGFISIQCFPTQIISLFNNDPELTTLAIKGIRIYLLMMPVVGINIVATSYYQSIGKAKISMFVSLLRQVILLIPFTIILPKFIGLDGVWAAGACADSLSVIITLVLLKKEFKQLDKMQLEKIA